LSQLTDEELMARFCDGDARAFDALFDRLGPAVQRFLSGMVRDAALAEDLTQTTFLSVIRSRDRYQRGAPVAPWVLSIAGNAARDTLRRRKLNVETQSKLTDPVPAVEAAPPDPGLRRQLEQALMQLPEAQREAVLLHKLQGYSFDQIAQMLGTTSTAARLKAHRGYERLKQLLGHLEDKA
jgi:RNA polymerase sigma-70 factor (ECF subfamily)